MNTQSISLDLAKGRTGEHVVIAQGDTAGTTIVAEIYDNGTALDLTGCTACFLMMQPDRMHYARDATPTCSGNVITYVVDEEAIAGVSGYTDECYFEIEMPGGEKVVSTQRFSMEILRDVMADRTPGANYDSKIAEAIERVDALKGEIEDAIKDAIDAVSDISELVVPLASKTVRGGATLGGSVQTVEQALEIRLVDGATGEVVTAESASYLNALTVRGKAVQDGTPTPDAPVPVQVVEGRNLLDQSKAVNKSGGESVSGDLIDGFTIVSANATTTARISNVPVEVGNTYTLSFNAVASAASVAMSVDVGDQNASGAGIGSIGVLLTNVKMRYSVTFTHGNATKHKHLDFSLTSANSSATITNVQLERGATATPFVPYGCIGLVDRLSNMVDVSPDKWEQGNFKADGSPDLGNADKRVRMKDAVAVVPGETYTFSIGGGYRYFWQAYDESGAHVAADSNYTAWITADTTFTPATATRIKVALAKLPEASVTPGDVAGSCIRLERGSVAHEDVAVTPIDLQGNVLASLPDGTRDELVVDSAGKVMLEKRVGKVTIDGTTVTMMNAATYAQLVIDDMLQQPTGGRVNTLRCNRFPSAIADESCYMAAKSFVIRYGANFSPTTGTELNAWLASNPVTVYYKLATPTENIDLGTIDPPATPSGSAISISASLTPTIDAEWWTEKAAPIPEALQASSSRIESQIAELREAIAEIATS